MHWLKGKRSFVIYSPKIWKFRTIEPSKQFIINNIIQAKLKIFLQRKGVEFHIKKNLEVKDIIQIIYHKTTN